MRTAGGAAGGWGTPATGKRGSPLAGEKGNPVPGNAHRRAAEDRKGPRLRGVTIRRGGHSEGRENGGRGPAPRGRGTRRPAAPRTRGRNAGFIPEKKSEGEARTPRPAAGSGAADGPNAP